VDLFVDPAARADLSNRRPVGGCESRVRGPEPLQEAAEHSDAGADIRRSASQAAEAWMALRIAKMDDDHGVGPARIEHEPNFALQRYSTALSDFVFAAVVEDIVAGKASNDTSTTTAVQVDPSLPVRCQPFVSERYPWERRKGTSQRLIDVRRSEKAPRTE